MIVKKLPSQLPIWPDAVRGGPNVLLRSAFFAGIQSSKRKTLGEQKSPDTEPEGVVIAAQDGQSIKYAGTQLNQYDADVFFEVLHRSRRHPLGNEATFSGADFLNSIGRSRNNLNYDDLDNSLRRLKRGTVDVSWNINGHRYIFTGSLIDSYTRELDSKLYRISLSPQMKQLFAPASWSVIEWDERMRLKGKPLAQWLHSYFTTHARPYPVSVAFLKDKTGSPTTLLKHFRVELRNALNTIQDAIGWTFEIEDDLVKVTRPPTESQARHLSRVDTRRKAVDDMKKEDRQRTMLSGRATPNPANQRPEMSSPGNILASLFDSKSRKR